MIKKRLSMRWFSIYKPNLGLTAPSIMKIKHVKKRLIPLLLIKRKILRKPLFYEWNLKEVGYTIKVLAPFLPKAVILWWFTIKCCRSWEKFWMYQLDEASLRDDFRFKSIEQLEWVKNAFVIGEWQPRQCWWITFGWTSLVSINCISQRNSMKS